MRGRVGPSRDISRSFPVTNDEKSSHHASDNAGIDAPDTTAPPGGTLTNLLPGSHGK